MGIEPTTSSLPRKRSTPELRRLFLHITDTQVQTYMNNLSCSTCKTPALTFQSLHPKALSGRRGSNPRPTAWKAVALPTELLPHTYYLYFIWCF